MNLVSASYSIQNEDSLYYPKNSISIEDTEYKQSTETFSKVVPPPQQMEYPP